MYKIRSLFLIVHDCILFILFIRWMLSLFSNISWSVANLCYLIQIFKWTLHLNLYFSLNTVKGMLIFYCVVHFPSVGGTAAFPREPLSVPLHHWLKYFYFHLSWREKLPILPKRQKCSMGLQSGIEIHLFISIGMEKCDAPGAHVIPGGRLLQFRMWWLNLNTSKNGSTNNQLFWVGRCQ